MYQRGVWLKKRRGFGDVKYITEMIFCIQSFIENILTYRYQTQIHGKMSSVIKAIQLHFISLTCNKSLSHQGAQ